MSTASHQSVMLALLSAACYGGALVATQFGLRHVPPLAGATVSITFTVALWLTLAPFLLDGSAWDPAAVLVFVAVGLFYPAVVMLLTYESNRTLGPTLTGTVSSTSPLFAISAAIIVLGERLTLPVASGGAAVATGLVLLALRAPMRTPPGRRLLLPLSGAVLRAAAQVLTKLGLAIWPSPFAAALICYATSFTVIWGAGASRLPRHALRYNRRGVTWFMAVGAMNGSGVLLMYHALHQGTVAVVSPIVATYPLFTALFSAIFLRREELTPRTLLGVAVVVAGVVTIVAG